MKVTLAGNLSLQIEDEWLFDGRAVPVVLKTTVRDEDVSFEDGKAQVTLDVPVELKISEAEWSRAMGEVIARYLRRTRIS